MRRELLLQKLGNAAKIRILHRVFAALYLAASYAAGDRIHRPQFKPFVARHTLERKNRGRCSGGKGRLYDLCCSLLPGVHREGRSSQFLCGPAAVFPDLHRRKSRLGAVCHLCRRGCNNRTKNIKAQKVSETRCFLSFFTQKPQVKQSASVYPKWRLGRQTRFFHVLTQ